MVAAAILEVCTVQHATTASTSRANGAGLCNPCRELPVIDDVSAFEVELRIKYEAGPR